jgi:putative FmdB family regulatory protein
MEVCVPTYSYACTECDNRFDVVQAFTDDSLTTCEQCSGRLRKLFNSVGVVFKGSGFYRTDSRESAKSATNGSAATSSSSGTEGSSSADKSGSSEKSSSSGDKSDSTKKSDSTTSKSAATTAS